MEGYLHAIRVDDPQPFAVLPQCHPSWLTQAIQMRALKCVCVIVDKVPRNAREQALFSVQYYPTCSDMLVFLLSVDGVDVNGLSTYMGRTKLDIYCDWLRRKEFPLEEVPKQICERNIRMLIDHGARIAGWHPAWVRAYHAARKAALEARIRAAYCLLATRFTRRFQLSKDVARLLACAVKNLDWHLWMQGGQ